ncbi:MFS transporter [Massilia psychrophila]|uniref:MFS transporter n=1 Tax=Massilia psychrophila TaxID=1603353 RepID=A0A2G8SZK9_9BURK|nr:MFS transporter [Massilia psychrophila]PIL38888.1 MFS transporter [Massilia psychrophila]GGE91932.1 MFS transporter [Massilia psychrophila]
MKPIETSAIREAERGAKMSRSALAWSWYQGGRDPYITLISIYIFMPYVATVMIGNAVKGQAMIAGFSLLGGVIAALTAPFLGAAADRMGRRLPPLKIMSLLFAPLVAVLWFARPDGSGLSVTAVLGITVLLSLLFTYSEVMHNALMPFAAQNRADDGSMSGLALALGNVVSVGALVFVLWAFALPGKVQWSLVPAAPLFGLDVALSEPSRVAAPIAAALFAFGVIPMFLFCRDAPPSNVGFWRALKDGARDLKVLVKSVRQHRDVAVFLGARMLYSDAQIALILFSGIYAAGVMHWGVLQMTAFGVLMSFFAALGGLLASVLDRVLGPKRAVQLEIIGTIIGLVTLLGVSPAGMKYVFTTQANAAPLWNGPVFTTLPELVFLGLGGIVAVFNTAIFASSRTFIMRMMPAGQSGAFFGLYALSATATVWLGPLVVKTTVSTFQSQQAGNVAIAILMFIGLLLVSLVRDNGQRQ